MDAGRNSKGEIVIHLNDDEARQMVEMIKGAKLPQRQVFHGLKTKLEECV